MRFAALPHGRYHPLRYWISIMHVFGFAGFSGSGKTTLIEQLIPLFTARGLHVSLIKHAHHTFDVDHPGKDSYRHRQAGAHEVMISSSRRWALMHELRGEAEPALDALIARMSSCDLLLVEGFKRAAMPKLEVFREAVGESPLHPHDAQIIAVATDAPMQAPIPVLDLNQPAAICEFILKHLGPQLHLVDAPPREASSP
jgi:molybdopterin-guanine dinucleotide biosynthesis protein B